MKACRVSIEEREYDRNHGLTFDQEQALFAQQENRWKLYVAQLLDGVTIEENGSKYNLVDRMADQYEEFSEFVNQDYDFMAAFKNGEFCEDVNNLFRSEARTLASIIVG